MVHAVENKADFASQVEWTIVINMTLIPIWINYLFLNWESYSSFFSLYCQHLLRIREPITIIDHELMVDMIHCSQVGPSKDLFDHLES